MYAPMGISPKSKGPRSLPMSANAGQCGRFAYSSAQSSFPSLDFGTPRYPVSPPKKTDLPPDVIDQEAQRVAARSWIERAEICWQGRQEIWAVIVSSELEDFEAGVGPSVEEMLVDVFSGEEEAVSVKST